MPDTLGSRALREQRLEPCLREPAYRLWLRPALRAFTSMRDVSLRRNR
ncbi:MAG TPA: hypothetical protein VLU41_01950 [Ideonella sp.]|nr:hypothetical protein [Ideonella sp.]